MTCEVLPCVYGLDPTDMIELFTYVLLALFVNAFLGVSNTGAAPFTPTIELFGMIYGVIDALCLLDTVLYLVTLRPLLPLLNDVCRMFAILSGCVTGVNCFVLENRPLVLFLEFDLFSGGLSAMVFSYS